MTKSAAAGGGKLVSAAWTRVAPRRNIARMRGIKRITSDAVFILFFGFTDNFDFAQLRPDFQLGVQGIIPVVRRHERNLASILQYGAGAPRRPAKPKSGRMLIAGSIFQCECDFFQ